MTWRLCEQRIAVTKAAAIPHSARVLAGKAGVTPGARVIRLRRPVGAAGRITWDVPAGPGHPRRRQSLICTR